VGDERLSALIATCGQHHVDRPAAAPGADEAVAPVENRRLGTVQLRLFRRIGLERWTIDFWKIRFAPDSTLEGAVYCEPVSGARPRGQAIDPVKPGEGAIKKERINPMH
jgi:hypothetical protein